VIAEKAANSEIYVNLVLALLKSPLFIKDALIG